MVPEQNLKPLDLVYVVVLSHGNPKDFLQAVDVAHLQLPSPLIGSQHPP